MIRLNDKWDELRDSGLLCCLCLDSDYNYCYEVKWTWADDSGHTTDTSGSFERAQDALNEAHRIITEDSRWITTKPAGEPSKH